MGDIQGRATTLRLSLILTTVPTAIIGLLRPYRQIGVVTTMVLVVLRTTQGCATDGELPATACDVFETSRPQYGFYSVAKHVLQLRLAHSWALTVPIYYSNTGLG